MKKLLLLLMMMLPPIVASAFSGVVEIDGIKYEISTKEQTANVTGPSSIDIAGALIIPSSIEYEGKTCYVKSVGGFTSCTGITSVTISEGIEIINYNAFKNCTNLESIILGKSVKEVGRSAFDGTAWYNSQEDGLLCLGHVAIQYKGDMTKDAEITIKEGITIIANSCFSGCNNLKRIHFPESLISIGQYSFSECTSLTTVSLHNVEVHYNAFRKCTSLKAVSLDDVKFVPNIVISGTMQIQDADFFSGSNSIDMVEINCKEIDDWFREKPLITKVTLGDKVEVINPGAFNGCTGIKQIEFPNSVKYLSGFSGCTGIASISIPASVERAGEYNQEIKGVTNVEIIPVSA